MTPIPKPFTWKSKKYLDYIRNQPCVICGHKSEAHHVRKSSNSGTAKKPGDYWCIPICTLHHSELHHFGFNTFLKNHNIDLYEELFRLTRGYIEANIKWFYQHPFLLSGCDRATNGPGRCEAARLLNVDPFKLAHWTKLLTGGYHDFSFKKRIRTPMAGYAKGRYLPGTGRIQGKAQVR